MSIHAAKTDISERAETAGIDPNGHPSGQGIAKGDLITDLSGRVGPQPSRLRSLILDNWHLLAMLGIALGAILVWL